eukprot:COSAG01_NODE_966_length_12397_cov_146.646528_4_plen_176_part_00
MSSGLLCRHGAPTAVPQRPGLGHTLWAHALGTRFGHTLWAGRSQHMKHRSAHESVGHGGAGRRRTDSCPPHHTFRYAPTSAAAGASLCSSQREGAAQVNCSQESRMKQMSAGEGAAAPTVAEAAVVAVLARAGRGDAAAQLVLPCLLRLDLLRAPLQLLLPLRLLLGAAAAAPSY